MPNSQRLGRLRPLGDQGMRVKHVAALAHLEAKLLGPASFGLGASAPWLLTPTVP